MGKPTPVIGLRMTDTRAAHVAALEQLTGLEGTTAVVDFALATALATFRARPLLPTGSAPRELVAEIRDGLAAALAELNEAAPESALRWVRAELLDYIVQISAALEG